MRRRRLPAITRTGARIIFVGANDGMIHAIDARTGYEVWAFIPYNLLPKLTTLRDGQAVDQFDYFVDSSPKIAEVKIERRRGAACCSFGEGPGGTFYQTFDVTEAGMGVDPDADDLGGRQLDARAVRHARTNRSCSSGRSRTTTASIRPTPRPSRVADGTPAASCGCTAI